MYSLVHFDFFAPCAVQNKFTSDLCGDVSVGQYVVHTCHYQSNLARAVLGFRLCWIDQSIGHMQHGNREKNRVELLQSGACTVVSFTRPLALFFSSDGSTDRSEEEENGLRYKNMKISTTIQPISSIPNSKSIIFFGGDDDGMCDAYFNTKKLQLNKQIMTSPQFIQHKNKFARLCMVRRA